VKAVVSEARRALTEDAVNILNVKKYGQVEVILFAIEQEYIFIYIL
jgi:hypothetical protein